MAFSENLEELKVFLQSEYLVLTGPIDEDDARSATEFLARESETLEERQGGDCSRHDGDGRPVGRSILTKTLEIPSLPVHVPILGTSDFSLPAQTKRAVTVGGGAQKMNRCRLPVVCVRFPKPFQFLAHSATNSNWRRGRDSNPRYPDRVHSISSAAPSATRSPLQEWRCRLAIGMRAQCNGRGGALPACFQRPYRSDATTPCSK